MAAMLDQFAERLGVTVHILEQFIAGIAPGAEAALQFAHIGVTKPLQPHGGTARQPLARIIDDDRRVEPGDAPARFLIDAAQRDLGSEERMALREIMFLAHVDQGDLVTGDQGGADIGRGGDLYAVQYVGGHAFLDLSQRLGMTRLAYPEMKILGVPSGAKVARSTAPILPP